MNWKKLFDYIKSHVNLMIFILLGIVILILYFSVKHKNNKITDLEAKYSLMTEEMISWKGSDSLQTARLYTVTNDNYRQFQKIKSQDSTITKLQEEVKRVKKQITEPGASVTVIDNNTHISGSTSTTVVTPVVPTESPVYETKPPFKDDWISLYIKATAKVISYDLTVRNQYSVVIGKENGKNFAQVTNFNPHTETMILRTYQVTVPKQKRLGIGVQLGYGLGAGGLTPYVGAGISYNLFYIK